MTTLIPHPTIRPRITETALCGWLGQAAPGDVLEYHRGFLIVDTHPAAERLSTEDRRELLRVARRALWAAEHNLVHLVQRRLGPDTFSYLAIVRPRSRTVPASLSALLTAEAA